MHLGGPCQRLWAIQTLPRITTAETEYIPLIVLDKPLTSLRADTSDRFNGKRYLNAKGRPVTRLRLVGEQAGKFYYAAADDLAAVLPAMIKPVGSATSIAIGGKLAGRKL